MRVLVCGDRTWDDYQTLSNALNTLCNVYPIDTIIEGEARGADRMAAKWAENERGYTVIKFPADWDKYGKSAGVIRNKQMLVEGQPSLVVAFHKNIQSSKGTLNMIYQANKAGIPVFLYS